MRANFVFSEMSPSAPGAVASSQRVQGAADYLPAGVVGTVDGYDGLEIIAELVGATGGTLDIYMQGSPDDGQNWYDVVHFPQLAAAAAATVYRAALSIATDTQPPVQIGKNLSPALAGSGSGSSAVVNGAFGDRLRLVMVAGASTAAGAPVTVRVMAQRKNHAPR